MSVYFVNILYLVNTFVAFCLKQVKKINTKQYVVIPWLGHYNGKE